MKNRHPYQVFRVSAKQRENASVNTLVFDKPLKKAIPGQFVMVWLPGVGEKPFCVADGDPFAVTVAVAGEFSRALHGREVEERVWVRGPFGRGFEIDGGRHLLVGGGYGAAPLLFLAKQIIRRGQPVVVCLGARGSEDLLLVGAFSEAGCAVRVATEDGSQGEKGLVTRLAEALINEFKPGMLYACGPLPMLSAIAPLCRKHSLPAQLSYEALMRCGIGLCGSCELDSPARAAAGIPPGWLTCKDGPVFIVSTDAPDR